jgi:hypothetical protein
MEEGTANYSSPNASSRRPTNGEHLLGIRGYRKSSNGVTTPILAPVRSDCARRYRTGTKAATFTSPP